MNELEANQLTEYGFAVDPFSLTSATARKGAFSYTVNFTRLDSPWRLTVRGPKFNNVEVRNFSHFWKLLNHVEKFSTL